MNGRKGPGGRGKAAAGGQGKDDFVFGPGSGDDSGWGSRSASTPKPARCSEAKTSAMVRRYTVTGSPSWSIAVAPRSK